MEKVIIKAKSMESSTSSKVFEVLQDDSGDSLEVADNILYSNLEKLDRILLIQILENLGLSDTLEIYNPKFSISELISI